LPPECCVFQAEIYAITKALEFTEESAEEKFVIWADSKSAIQAITNTDIMPKLSREVIKCYIKLHAAMEKKVIFIQWIPAHTGIIENEIADTYARSAVEVGISFNELDTP
jgi:ribonuclease HI